MEENNKLIFFEQDKLISKVSNSLRIANKLLPIKIEPDLIPYRKGNKWGFCTPDKEIVIDCVYDDTFQFIEGFAIVKIDGKFGFIDTNGNVICEIIYEKVYEFNDGLAKVKLNNKFGFINNNGEIIIDIIYDKTCNFHEGLVAVDFNEKYGILNREGVLILDYIFDKIEDNGHDITDYRASEGLLCVRKENKYGFIDIKNFNVVIPFIYEFAYNFSDGLAKVKLDSKYGFINKKNEVIIPFLYDYQTASWLDINCKFSFQNGVAFLKKNDKWGAINNIGKQVIPFIYDAFGVHVSDYELIDYKNRQCSRESFIGDVINVLYNEKFGLIDSKGNIILECNYKYVTGFSKDTFILKSENGYSVIDKKGKNISGCVFDFINELTDDFAFVTNSKSGFINKNGEIVIDLIYDYDGNSSFINGLARVSKNNCKGYINKKGVEYWED
jgi:hypothetical protein